MLLHLYRGDVVETFCVVDVSNSDDVVEIFGVVEDYNRDDVGVEIFCAVEDSVYCF